MILEQMHITSQELDFFKISARGLLFDIGLGCNVGKYLPEHISFTRKNYYVLSYRNTLLFCCPLWIIMCMKQIIQRGNIMEIIIFRRLFNVYLGAFWPPRFQN